jgi:hypothetical protein
MSFRVDRRRHLQRSTPSSLFPAHGAWIRFRSVMSAQNHNTYWSLATATSSNHRSDLEQGLDRVSAFLFCHPPSRACRASPRRAASWHSKMVGPREGLWERKAQEYHERGPSRHRCCSSRSSKVAANSPPVAVSLGEKRWIIPRATSRTKEIVRYPTIRRATPPRAAVPLVSIATHRQVTLALINNITP